MMLKTLKKEFEMNLGALLAKRQDHHFKATNALGSFECKIENHDSFLIVGRDFQSDTERLTIPVGSDQPSIQMLFSFNGQSVFRDQYNPFILSTARHSLNYFNAFDCRNLLDRKARQNDMSILLGESFYKDLVTEQYAGAGNHLFDKINRGEEFNTINQHLPIDTGISGILHGIRHCPYKGEMKKTFLREHIRALLTLQFYHFHHTVAGKDLAVDTRITARDTEVLHAIKDYLDQHFLEPASLRGLSKAFGINEFKLKYGFKKLFNTSPIKYLQQKRLELSLLLLRETDKSVAEIADEMGYNHPNNFSLAFRKTFGQSPLFYRAAGSR